MSLQTSASQPRLRKELTGRQLFTLGFGTIIGVAWVVVLGEWLSEAGPGGSMLGFLAGGLLMTAVGVCYAEMATMLPASGGEMAYAYEAFGIRSSFAIGWFLLLVWVASASFEAISVGWVASTLIPGIEGPTLYESGGTPVQLGSLLLGLGGMLLITLLNLRGAREAARFQEILTYALLVCAAAFLTAGLAWGETAHLQPLFQRDPDGSIWTGMLMVCVTAPFWYGGFNVIPQVMEEKAPGTSSRFAGRMIVLSILLAGVFYLVVILSASMSMPWQELIDLPLPAAGAFQAAFDSVWMARVVLVAALLGLLTTWNAVFIAGSRVLFALGRAHMILPFFGRAHSRLGTPIAAILFVALAGSFGIFLGRTAIIPIANVGAVCLALANLVTCLAVIRLRRIQPERHRPYRVPGGMVMASLAAAASVFMACTAFYQPYAKGSGSIPLEWIYLVGWTLLGAALWTGSRKIRSNIEEATRQKLMRGEEDCG